MTSDVMKVEGLKELTRSLDRLGTTGANRAVRSGVRRTALQIKKEVQAKAPVGHITRTRRGKRASSGSKNKVITPGTLRRNISVRTRAKRFAVGGSFSATIGFKGQGFHGSFIELGTRYHQPRPFLRPTFEIHAAKAPDMLLKHLEEAIQKERMRNKR